MLFTFIYPKSICLFISSPHPNQVYEKQIKKIFLSGDLCVLYNVMLWNVFFPEWHFTVFSGLLQKKLLQTMVGTFYKH